MTETVCQSRQRRRPRMLDLVTLASLVYFPVAVTAMTPYLVDDPSRLLDAFPNSPAKSFLQEALAGRAGPYQHSLVLMFVHTVTGGLLMLLGPWQLAMVRGGKKQEHRVFGRIFVGLVYLSMLGATGYLLRTPMHEVFSGPVFALSLWTIMVGTVYSCTLGWLGAMRRDLSSHVRWICLCYGFLMSAPVLRLGWGLSGLAGVGHTLETASPPVVMFTGSLVAVGGVLGGAMLDNYSARRVVTTPWLPRWALAAASVVGAIGVAGLVAIHLDLGRRATVNLGWFLVPWLLFIAAFAQRWARHRERALVVQESRVHVAALLLAPALALLIVPIGTTLLPITTAEAVGTGCATCVGLMLTWSLAYVTYRLRGLRAAPLATVDSGKRLETV